ncbi:hypothetical protein BD410DRAFT_756059, partial [Rickenella mellea]
MEQLSRLIKDTWHRPRWTMRSALQRRAIRSSQSSFDSPWHHPALTGYRLILITLTVSFGLSKALLAYRGRSSQPTTLEWIFGVVIGLILYWLGWYEDKDEMFYRIPWLFEKDYRRPVTGVFRTIFLAISIIAAVIIFWFVLPTLAVVVAIEWSNAESGWVILMKCVLAMVTCLVLWIVSFALGIGIVLPLGDAMRN